MAPELQAIREPGVACDRRARPEAAMQAQSAHLSRDRFFAPDPDQRRLARELHEAVAELPIVSPHGQTIAAPSVGIDPLSR